MTVLDPRAVTHVAEAIAVELERHEASNYDDFPLNPIALARVAITAHLDFINRMSRDS